MSNCRFDTNGQKQGFCCPFAYFKINPTRTIMQTKEVLDVGRATVFYQRKAFRQGETSCMRRNSCLRALWESPFDSKQADAAIPDDVMAVLKEDKQSKFYEPKEKKGANEKGGS
jgi:hypothetical protein